MSRQARISALLSTFGLAPAAAALPDPSPVASADGGDAPVDVLTVEQGETLATAALDKGKAEGRDEGFKAAQDRMVAVMGSDVGKSQPAAAVALLAAAPDMTAEAAIATLGAMAPAPAAPAPAPAAPGGAAAIGADLNNTPKVNVSSAANDGKTNENQVDAVALWDGVQGTKNGVKIGPATQAA